MIRCILLTTLVLFSPLFTWAQSDTSEFTIQIFGSSDAIAPTTPVIQSVAPIGPTQIDLSWSSSTDNFVVFGYVVARDGVPIATTTVLSFSDTGLTASTTYSYTVYAFDGVPNYSASSTPVATTTPDVILPPEDTGSPGTRVSIDLESLTVKPGVATATLDIITSNRARVEVRYGLTNSYELAYVVGNELQMSHQVNLYDLLPNTTYFYEIIAYAPGGAQTLLDQGSFTTVDDTPPQPPTNVSGLSAVQQGDDVSLAYQLPPDFPAGGSVRIVRSHFGYPQFLSDGVIVYEGNAEQATDAGVFSFRDEAYYTVFVIDPNGLISSGAIVRVVDGRITSVIPTTPTPVYPRPQPAPTPVTPAPEPIPAPVPTSTIPTTPTPPAGSLDEVGGSDGFPDLRHFTVSQSDQLWSFSSSSINLSSDEPFTVSVSSDLITGDFKTIVATLYDPRQSGKQFSFLLRLNGDRTAYAATIAPLRIAGVADLVVEVFDHDSLVVSEYRTDVTFAKSTMATSTTLTQWYWQLQSWLWWLLLAVPFLVIGWLWFIFARRDREDEDNASI